MGPSPGQPGGGRAGLKLGPSDPRPSPESRLEQGLDKGVASGAAAGPHGTEVGQQGTHAEGGL